MFLLSTFTPSSVINQDYANRKSLIFAARESSWGMMENIKKREDELCTLPCWLQRCGQCWPLRSPLPRSQVDLPGEQVRKERKPAPVPILNTHTHARTHARTHTHTHKHTLSLLVLNPSVPPSHSITHLFPSHPPSSHVSNSPTVHRD